MNERSLPTPAQWLSGWLAGWNRFWFAPTDPATLSLIRVLAGAMLFYTHAVWSLDLVGFFGPEGWLPRDLMREQILFDQPFVWSYFWWIDSPALLWIVHVAALVVFAMLMLGFYSRVVAVLAYIAAISYAQRITPGAYFGLDRINCLLAMYLMLGPCGARYSLDAWLRRRSMVRGEESEVRGQGQDDAKHRSGSRQTSGKPATDTVTSGSLATSAAARAGSLATSATDGAIVGPSVAANIAIRLIQLHMCVIYFFSASAKLLGAAWWDGTAVWWAVAIYEYQSIDMTWLAAWPVLVAALTYGTVFWELTYPVLVWPRATKPIVLAVAVLAHGGIALFLGMITFGLVMLIGNLAFVPPQLVRMVVERRSRT
jgi:hypothetical protein